MSISTTESTPVAADSIVILTPVFNDWACLSLLIPVLERVLGENQIQAKVLVVDDGSTVAPGTDRLQNGPYQVIRAVEILELRRNLGHQRAIAIGLAHIEEHETCDTVVVMDCDGEDNPADIPRMLEAYRDEGGGKIVFAERSQRSESALFRAFYRLYKLAYKLLTGRNVRFGNFSVVPRRCLTSLVAVSEMWNHYAAAVLKSRQPLCMISTQRGKRLHGEPKMNFVGLVIHGLSAISVDSDLVGVRLLVVSLALIVLAFVGLIAIVFIKLATTLAIPGWATTAVGLISILLFQTIMLAVIFSFITLSGRNLSFFLPKRDYVHFVSRTYLLWRKP
jgi:polyisoprenyl-phosphate glycosyltransferase